MLRTIYHRLALLIIVGSQISVHCLANPFELAKGAPVEVLADRLSLSNDIKVAEYSGNVVVSQGKLKFEADLVKVVSDDDNKIQKIKAFSKGKRFVTFHSSYAEEPIEATATTLLYDLKSQQINLKGDPVEITYFSNFLSANEFKLNLKTRNMQAIGTNQPAKLRFKQAD